MKAIFIKAILMTIMITGLNHTAVFSQTNQSLFKSSSITPQRNISGEYYIFLDNIKTRQDVLDLESMIQKKNGVTYFMAERYPVRCFVMKTQKEVTKETFQNWVGQKYPIVTFGKGSLAREQAYLQYKKNRKTIH